MKKKVFVFTSKGDRPQACVYPLSYVGSLRVYMYMRGKEGPSTLAILITEDPTALQCWSDL